ncbi:MAG: hypothetical protein ABFC80_02230 [Coriobacteriales bacterium]
MPMRIAVLQVALRPDRDDQVRALAEANARAIAQGAEAVFSAAIPDAGIVATADGSSAIGSLVRLEGDAALDHAEHARALSERPDVLVLSPGAESELQAEAVLELALGLSTSVAGLVLVTEHAGAPAGEPGHGGSAIVLLGEVVAEAVNEDDVITAEIPVPVPAPKPRSPLPAVAPILEQRLAHHRGRRLDPDYLADLS